MISVLSGDIKNMDDKLLRNCKFKFQCDQRWETMQTTDDENVKFCEKCNETVHLCKNPWDLEIVIRENKCVALLEKNDDKVPILIGDVDLDDFLKIKK